MLSTSRANISTFQFCPTDLLSHITCPPQPMSDVAPASSESGELCRTFHCDCTRYCKGIMTLVSERTYRRHRKSRLALGPDQFSSEFTQFLAETARNFLQPSSSQPREPGPQKRTCNGQEMDSQRVRDKRRRTEQPQNGQREEISVSYKFTFFLTYSNLSCLDGWAY
jgi:hypothetical protein